jgi:XTP/dITP diphosphohydrolase
MLQHHFATTAATRHRRQAAAMSVLAVVQQQDVAEINILIRLLFASRNAAKIEEAKKFFGKDFLVLSPSDLHIDIDVVEDSETIQGNSLKKCQAYMDLVPEDMFVVSDDTGLEIRILDNMPGVLTRRWAGISVSDDELENICLDKLKQYPEEKDRYAQFRTVITVGKQGATQNFAGILAGIILPERAHKNTIEGFPFRDLFYIKEFDATLSDLDDIRTKNKLKFNREIALEQAANFMRSESSLR